MAIAINSNFKVQAALPLDARAYLTKAEMLAVDENVYPDYFLAICSDNGFLYMFDKSVEDADKNLETGKFKLFAGSDVNELVNKLVADVDTDGSVLNLIREKGATATYTSHTVDVFDEVTGDKTGELTVVDETIKGALDRLAKDLTYKGTVEELPESPAQGDLYNVVPGTGAAADAPKGWKFYDGENWQSLDDPTLSARVTALEALHDTKDDDSFKTVKEEVIENAKDGIYKAAVEAKDAVGTEGEDDYVPAVEAADAVTIEDAIAALEEMADVAAGALVYRGEVTAETALPADAKKGDLYHIVPTDGDSEWQFFDGTDWKSISSDADARLDALETQVGRDKDVNAYNEKTDLVDIVNLLTDAVDETGSVKNIVYSEAKDATYKAGTTSTVKKYESISNPGTFLTEAEYNTKVDDGEDVSDWEEKNTQVTSDALTIEEGIDKALADAVVTMMAVTNAADIDDSSILKKYKFYQGLTDAAVAEESKLIGTIDLPKDLVVTSGSVVELKASTIPNPAYVDEDSTPDEPEELEVVKCGDDTIAAGDVADEDSTYYGYPTTAGTYIKLVIANQKAPVFIDAKSLVDTGSLGSTTEDVTANVEVGGVMVGDKIESGTDIQELVERLLIKYYPPTVTLSATPSNKVVELGESINVELSAAVTKKSLDITSVTFSDGGAATDVEDGGTFTHEIADAVTDTTTFSVSVTDGKKTATSSVTYTFVNPYYTGVVDADATEVDLTTLTKKVEIKGKKKYTYTAANQYIVFAYPASYGALTSILDPSSFENLGSFNKTTATVGGVSYTVYTSATPVTCDGFSYTFS